MAGRPKVDLQEVFTKIQPFLQVGYSFHKSCIMALVPYSTVIPYYNTDEDFRNKVERERNLVNIVARQNIIKKIQGKKTKQIIDGKEVEVVVEGDVDTSFAWLSRQEKDEFSTRQEVTGKDGEPVGGGSAVATPKEALSILASIEAIVSNVSEQNEPVQDSTSK